MEDRRWKMEDGRWERFQRHQNYGASGSRNGQAEDLPHNVRTYQLR